MRDPTGIMYHGISKATIPHVIPSQTANYTDIIPTLVTPPVKKAWAWNYGDTILENYGENYWGITGTPYLIPLLLVRN